MIATTFYLTLLYTGHPIANLPLEQYLTQEVVMPYQLKDADTVLLAPKNMVVEVVSTRFNLAKMQYEVFLSPLEFTNELARDDFRLLLQNANWKVAGIG